MPRESQGQGLEPIEQGNRVTMRWPCLLCDCLIRTPSSPVQALRDRHRGAASSAYTQTHTQTHATSTLAGAQLVFHVLSLLHPQSMGMDSAIVVKQHVRRAPSCAYLVLVASEASRLWSLERLPSPRPHPILPSPYACEL